MSRITTGNFPLSLTPGVVSAWFGEKVNRYPKIYDQIFETINTNKYEETFTSVTGMGLPQRKFESSSIVYDTRQQYQSVRIRQENWALGFIISQDELDFNQYEELALDRTDELADRSVLLKEYQAALVLDRALSSSYTGYDGVSLLNTAHVLGSGATASNTLATQADISALAVQQIITQIRSAVDETNLPMYLMPQKLIGNVGEEFLINEILNTEYKLDSAENNINSIQYNKMIPGGAVITPYTTDATGWYVTTNVKDGLVNLVNKAPEFDMIPDFDTKSMKFSMFERFKMYWVNWRCLYGCQGP